MKHFLVLTLMLLGLAACDHEEPVGKWSPMKWSNVSKMAQDRDGAYLVPAGGGTFTFNCRNYGNFWLDEAIEGDMRYRPGMPVITAQGDTIFTPLEEVDWHRLSNSWFDAQASKADLVLNFAPLPDTVLSRAMCLTVTAGDIFYHFSFQQTHQQ